MISCLVLWKIRAPGEVQAPPSTALQEGISIEMPVQKTMRQSAWSVSLHSERGERGTRKGRCSTRKRIQPFSVLN